MAQNFAGAVYDKSPLSPALAVIAQFHRVFHTLVVHAGDGLDFHGQRSAGFVEPRMRDGAAAS